MGLLTPLSQAKVGGFGRRTTDAVRRYPVCDRWRVICLALLLTPLTGCGLLERHLSPSCKSRAFVRIGVEDYLRTNYPRADSVRAVVLPFLAPLNLKAARFEQVPESFGGEVARILQTQLLSAGILPIVELSFHGPRVSPFTDLFGGNHELLDWARTQGYDLVIIGQVEQFSSLEELTLTGKVIDVTRGVTLWYGRGAVSSQRAPIPEYRSLTEEGVRCLLSTFLDEGDQ